jgi:hypothetical protein
MSIPNDLLDKACQEVGNLPFWSRGIKISRELIGRTMEILNTEPGKELPQNCRNALRENTPDGLDKRIKERLNSNLRRANIISDILENTKIVEVFSKPNPRTGRQIKWTRLLQRWYW